jgi:hypothetical protein
MNCCVDGCHHDTQQDAENKDYSKALFLHSPEEAEESRKASARAAWSTPEIRMELLQQPPPF